MKKIIKKVERNIAEVEIIQQIRLALLMTAYGITLGLIFNVAANVIYDNFVRGNRIFEITSLILFIFSIFSLVYLLIHYQKEVKRIFAHTTKILK